MRRGARGEAWPLLPAQPGVAGVGAATQARGRGTAAPRHFVSFACAQRHGASRPTAQHDFWQPVRGRRDTLRSAGV